MVDIKRMYQDIWNAVNGICDKTFLRSRPKSIETKVGSYIVVKIPYTIRNNEIDSDGFYNDYSTTIQIEIYVRDNVSASNPNEFNINVMDRKVKSVLGKFPIVTEFNSITRPNVVIESDDGDGFGVTIIQARLRTR